MKHLDIGSPAVAVGNTLEEAVGKAEWREGVQARVAAVPDVAPPALPASPPLVPVHEGLETNPDTPGGFNHV